jgi:hypothetical protein
MALLDDLMMAGQTPWARGQQYDWQNPGAMMSMLPESDIRKLLGMGAPQTMAAPQPATPQIQASPAAKPVDQSPGDPAGAVTQAAAPQRSPLPPPVTEPTAPKRVPGAQRPNFSDQTGFSDVAGALMQGAGGILGPIGQLVGGSGARREEGIRKNQTFDWLIRQGASPQDAEFIVRNPEVLKSVFAQKFGAGKFGKQGAVFEAGGKFYTIQFGEDGSRKILPVEAPGTAGNPSTPLAPAKGVKLVDDGTGTRLVSGATGGDVRRIERDIVGRERMEQEGRGLGELRTKLPTLKSRMQIYEDKAKRLDETIDKAISRIGVTTVGPLGSIMLHLPATEARALRGDLDTIRANVGFDELQAMRDASPTGGALGQVSEMENRLLQSVRAAIDQLQSGEDIKRNLQIIKDSNRQLREIQRQKLAEDEKRALGEAPITGTKKRLKFNPATGELE